MTNAVMPTYGRFDLAFERGEGVYLLMQKAQPIWTFAAALP